MFSEYPFRGMHIRRTQCSDVGVRAALIILPPWPPPFPPSPPMQDAGAYCMAYRPGRKYVAQSAGPMPTSQNTSQNFENSHEWADSHRQNFGAASPFAATTSKTDSTCLGHVPAFSGIQQHAKARSTEIHQRPENSFQATRLSPHSRRNVIATPTATAVRKGRYKYVIHGS